MARRSLRPLALIVIVAEMFGLGFMPRGGARSARAQEVDRAAVVQQFIDARNAGDIDGAVATLTANPLYVGVAPCSEATPCIGTDAVRRNLELLKGAHFTVSVVTMEASGSAVTGRIESKSDAVHAAGVDRTVSSFIAQVPQDKIADWFQAPDFTDSQTAQFLRGSVAQALAADPEPGPYGVGVTRRTFVRSSSTTGEPRYLNTVIWYPADASAGSLARDRQLAAPPDAVPDGSGAPHPVILWSHGSPGEPWNSTFFTTHLASAGFVVIAPAHLGNTSDTCPVPCMLSNPAWVLAVADSAANRPDDLSFVLDQALLLSRSADAVLGGLLDGDRVGMAGHSAGGATALATVAQDSRVLAGVALAPGAGMRPMSQLAAAAAPLLTLPMMVMGGMLDDQVSFPQMQAWFDEMNPTHKDNLFVTFRRGGHFNFADLCLAGRAGCRSGDLPQADAHVRINRWATAFLLRYVAGDESGAASLEASLSQGDSEVQVTHSP